MFCINNRGVFERFLWIKASVTLVVQVLQNGCDTVIYSGFRASDTNKLPSGKDCHFNICVCLRWKMKNPEWKQKGLLFFFLSLITFARHFQGHVPYSSFYALWSGPLTLDEMAALHQSPAQPRRGESDATNNIITALVHISLIWQQPSLTRSHAPLLGFIIIIM